MRLWISAVLFFLSGFAALLYQVEPERQVLQLLQQRRPVPAVQGLLADPQLAFRSAAMRRVTTNPDVSALIESYLRQTTVTSIGGRFAGDTADLNTDLHPREEFSRSRTGEHR